MTNEFKKEEPDCFCKTKSFKKFIVTTLATFLGVFMALCLFCLLHKPPVIMTPYGAMPMPMQMNPNPYMMAPAFHHCNCLCHKKMMKKYLKAKESENEKTEADD